MFSIVYLSSFRFSSFKNWNFQISLCYSRMELVEKVLGYDFEGYERTIDSHVKNLRAKIGDNPRNPKWLHTVHGVGYRFEDPTKQAN